MMFIPTVPLSIRLDGELLLLVRLVIGVHVFLTFIIWFYLYKFWTNSQPEASSHPPETEVKTEESQYSNGLYTIDEEPWAQEAQQEYEHPQEELELYQKSPRQEAPREQQEYPQQIPQKQQTPPQKQAQQQKKPQPLKVPKKKQAPQQQQQEEEESYAQPQPVKPQIVGALNRGRTSPKRA